jgi:hypothetical protein
MKSALDPDGDVLDAAGALCLAGGAFDADARDLPVPGFFVPGGHLHDAADVIAEGVAGAANRVGFEEAAELDLGRVHVSRRGSELQI